MANPKDCVKKVKSLLKDLTEPFYIDSPFLPYESESKDSYIPHHRYLGYRSFLDRIVTYKPDYWYRYPIAAILFAQYGFVNTEKTCVVCTSCKMKTDPAAYLSKPDFIPALAVRAHDKGCRWEFFKTPEAYFKIPRAPQHVVTNLRLIWKDLIEMGPCLPIVSKTTQNNMGISKDFVESLLKYFGSSVTESGTSALILGVCGWFKNSGNCLQCKFCSREIGTWNYHTFGSGSYKAEVGKPKRNVIEVLYSKIRSNVENESETDKGSSMTSMKGKNSQTTVTKLVPKQIHPSRIGNKKASALIRSYKKSAVKKLTFLKQRKDHRMYVCDKGPVFSQQTSQKSCFNNIRLVEISDVRSLKPDEAETLPLPLAECVSDGSFFDTTFGIQDYNQMSPTSQDIQFKYCSFEIFNSNSENKDVLEKERNVLNIDGSYAPPEQKSGEFKSAPAKRDIRSSNSAIMSGAVPKDRSSDLPQTSCVEANKNCVKRERCVKTSNGSHRDSVVSSHGSGAPVNKKVHSADSVGDTGSISDEAEIIPKKECNGVDGISPDNSRDNADSLLKIREVNLSKGPSQASMASFNSNSEGGNTNIGNIKIVKKHQQIMKVDKNDQNLKSQDAETNRKFQTVDSKQFAGSNSKEKEKIQSKDEKSIPANNLRINFSQNCYNGDVTEDEIDKNTKSVTSGETKIEKCVGSSADVDTVKNVITKKESAVPDTNSKHVECIDESAMDTTPVYNIHVEGKRAIGEMCEKGNREKGQLHVNRQDAKVDNKGVEKAFTSETNDIADTSLVSKMDVQQVSYERDNNNSKIAQKEKLIENDKSTVVAVKCSLAENGYLQDNSTSNFKNKCEMELQQKEGNVSSTLPHPIPERAPVSVHEPTPQASVSLPTKRKFVDINDDDDDSHKQPEKKIIFDLPTSYFHPELEHRFWCLWRVRSRGKKGWEYTVESAAKGIVQRRSEAEKEEHTMSKMKGIHSVVQRM